MKKRSYRAKSIQQIQTRSVGSLAGKRVVLGIDIAKAMCFGRLLDSERQVVESVKWDQGTDTPTLVQWLCGLDAGSVEVAMEPSGTYGDALRHQLMQAGFAVYRVSGKRTHDAAEIYDGVPSIHDSKAADLVARLHLDGVSRRWDEGTDEARGLRAKVAWLGFQTDALRQSLNRLDAQLARFWPELTRHVELGSATILAVCETYGGPRAMRDNAQDVRAVLSAVGGRFLRSETIEAILASAQHTIGVPMVDDEVALVKALAGEARRLRTAKEAAEAEVRRLGRGDDAVRGMTDVVGACTAAVIVSHVGSPNAYPHPAAYRKAMGLNLKERSSGTKQGQLSLTKRGSSEVRRVLYLAALRLIQVEHGDPVVRAFYLKKVQRDGGRHKKKAVVAVMRKLALALWHVGRGATFDSQRLFDTSKLSWTEKQAA
jgi:transposase